MQLPYLGGMSRYEVLENTANRIARLASAELRREPPSVTSPKRRREVVEGDFNRILREVMTEQG
ncbi:MAG: hypothetical protein HQL56_19015 [Magnetococcales bacterium]|nr:hypothetical protein [Magnetococcales bacterium]